MMKTKNKKAQIQSFLPYILVGLVVIMIFSLLVKPVAYVSDKVLTELKTNEEISQKNTTVEKIGQVQSLITPALDQLIFILLLSLMIGSLIIAISSDFHPVALGAFIISIVLLIIIGGLMGNVYEEVGDNDILANTSSEFSFSNLVMGSHLPIVIMVFGILGIIIIMSKRGRGSAPV